MLSDIFDPILRATARHLFRLNFVGELKPAPGIVLPLSDLREESARMAQDELREIIQVKYQQLADEQTTLEQKFNAIAAAEKELLNLMRPRLPQVEKRPDEGLETLLVIASTSAAQVVYASVLRLV